MVSIVIPLFNKEKYVNRAIASILSQSFHDFEIIIVDDGSTDKSVEVVQNIKDIRVRLIKQSNKGVSSARNRGIAESKSNLIVFLDADDVHKPHFLETILRLYQKHPMAGAYAAAYEIKEANGKIRHPKFKAIPPYPWEGILPNYFESALGPPPVWTSATAVPKKIFADVGYFPVGENNAEDLDMWLRVALQYKIAYSTYVGAVYCRDDKNSLHRLYSQNLDQNGYRIVRTIDEFLVNNFVDKYTKELLLEIKARAVIVFSALCIMMLRPELARAHFKKYKTKKLLLANLYWKFLASMPVFLINLLLSFKRLFCVDK